MRLALILSACLSCHAATAFTAGTPVDDTALDSDAIGAIAPIAEKNGKSTSPQVDWSGLTRSSLRFLGVMHAFRWATEPGTRSGGIGLGGGYFQSIRSLHGWSDGDPAYVNYVGHPMQGAVSANLYLLHDRRFRQTEFGGSRNYWRGKARATAFAWAFSEQFEIGPLSEASIGHIQRDYPQQGFVDHVVTPVFGLGWSVGEDALDRFVVRPFERRVSSPWMRAVVRSALNPARGFANLMDLKRPWHREARAGVTAYTPVGDVVLLKRPDGPGDPSYNLPLELHFFLESLKFPGTFCTGAGAEAALRVSPQWDVALNVSGCRLLGLPKDESGDALLYQLGPRWTPMRNRGWSPYLHLLVGGLKITRDNEAADGVSVSAGMGLEYKLNPAIAFRLAGLNYVHSSVQPVGPGAANLFEVTSGVVLRLGSRQ